MSVLDDIDFGFALRLWGYDLRGPRVLDIGAAVAENAQTGGLALWDHGAHDDMGVLFLDDRQVDLRAERAWWWLPCVALQVIFEGRGDMPYRGRLWE